MLKFLLHTNLVCIISFRVMIDSYAFKFTGTFQIILQYVFEDYSTNICCIEMNDITFEIFGMSALKKLYFQKV